MKANGKMPMTCVPQTKRTSVVGKKMYGGGPPKAPTRMQKHSARYSGG